MATPTKWTLATKTVASIIMRCSLKQMGGSPLRALLMNSVATRINSALQADRARSVKRIMECEAIMPGRSLAVVTQTRLVHQPESSTNATIARPGSGQVRPRTSRASVLARSTIRGRMVAGTRDRRAVIVLEGSIRCDTRRYRAGCVLQGVSLVDIVRTACMGTVRDQRGGMEHELLQRLRQHQQGSIQR